ncbi:MAG TPA: hypothetical protein VKA46_31315 [Gemmataceae bacterium]|nr:hypothetical protein [Gemmataceae bacterium]
MRYVSAGLVVFASVVALAADAPAKRFGVEADLKTFPQATPEEALASVLKAIEMKRPDYIVAQLGDPDFVDRRVKETSYDELLAETTAKLVSDPGAVKQLRAFLEKGTWDKEDATASVTLKEGTERLASFRKAGGRWFLKQPSRKPVPKTERE